MNDLRLPIDVVLTNSNEELITEVVINNTLKASQGLIIHGNINRIDFKSFISRRVTLKTSKNSAQEIFSSIDFNENVVLKGNFWGGKGLRFNKM